MLYSKPMTNRKTLMKRMPGWMAMGLLTIVLATECQKKDDTVDCTVYWQLYQQEKYATTESIEQAFHDTFTAFWKNSPTENSVRVTGISRSDVRSLTLKLAQMADEKITEELDPSLSYTVQVKVFIDFDGSYVEEVWDKTYD